MFQTWGTLVCNNREKYYSAQFNFNIISTAIAMTEGDLFECHYQLF